MRCPNCAHPNIPGADLCESCGSDLAGLDLPESSAGFDGRLLGDRIDRLDVKAPLIVAPDATVAEAIALLRREKQGCVLVQDGDQLVGILTERDVLTRVVRPDLDAEKTPISSVMTAAPLTLELSDPAAFAIHRMVVEGLRHLPVVQGGTPVGFISVRNVLRYLHADVLRG
ncbi:MAG: CBS domain-containing protein [Thermoanaerobaculia bacterium]